MKVLIVHDRDAVADQLQELISDNCAHANLQAVGDVSSARSLLRSSFYDLLILDLTLPAIKGRSAEGFFIAESFLEEIMAGGDIFTPGHILGITRDAEALDCIQNNIGPHLMAIISESEEDTWKKHVVDRVKYVEFSSKSQAKSLVTRFDFDVLFITALDKELKPFGDFFELHDLEGLPGVKQFIFSDKAGVMRRGACYAIGRAGQPTAASDTQGLIGRLRPRLAIMTGFCGGVPSKTNLGDILFAEMAIDWDYGKWKPTESASRLYARPEPVGIRNTKIHRIAREVVQNGLTNSEALLEKYMFLTGGEVNGIKLHLIPFASGSAVIGDSNVLESIKSLNEGVGGVDMESFGFYVACQHSMTVRPNFICIKAVADDCGPEKDDRLHVGCSFASAYIGKSIVKDIWDFDEQI